MSDDFERICAASIRGRLGVEDWDRSHKNLKALERRGMAAALREMHRLGLLTKGQLSALLQQAKDKPE